jgi:hypothetical protein
MPKSALYIDTGVVQDDRGNTVPIGTFPTGGGTGQSLVKNGPGNYDYTWANPTGPAGPVYLDIVDTIYNTIVDGTVFTFYAPRALTFTAGKFFLAVGQSTDLTVTINVNSVAKATVTVPATALVGTLSTTVTANADDQISLVISGSNGAQTLSYYLKGAPL